MKLEEFQLKSVKAEMRRNEPEALLEVLAQPPPLTPFGCLEQQASKHQRGLRLGAAAEQVRHCRRAERLPLCHGSAAGADSRKEACAAHASAAGRRRRRRHSVCHDENLPSASCRGEKQRRSRGRSGGGSLNATHYLALYRRALQVPVCGTDVLTAIKLRCNSA